jgi:hypothetical protein
VTLKPLSVSLPHGLRFLPPPLPATPFPALAFGRLRDLTVCLVSKFADALTMGFKDAVQVERLARCALYQRGRIASGKEVDPVVIREEELARVGARSRRENRRARRPNNASMRGKSSAFSRPGGNVFISMVNLLCFFGDGAQRLKVSGPPRTKSLNVTKLITSTKSPRLKPPRARRVRLHCPVRPECVTAMGTPLDDHAKIMQLPVPDPVTLLVSHFAPAFLSSRTISAFSLPSKLSSANSNAVLPSTSFSLTRAPRSNTK